MSDIRPGLRVEFFYYSDYEKENIHVLRSIIHDVFGKKIILAQPSPSVLRSSLNRKIVITYLMKQEGKPTRFGFGATITDLLQSYQLSSGDSAFAIAVEQTGSPKPFDIRFHYRVRVPSRNDLTLIINNAKATLIDISIGGAMISGELAKGLQPHEKIETSVRLPDQTFHLEAQVLRVWSPTSDRRPQAAQFAALRFLNAPKLFESALGKVILKIQRQLAAGDFK